MKSKEIGAMKKFADECKKAKYNKTEAWTLAVIAGSAEAIEKYGSIENAYNTAIEYIKKYLTAADAIWNFEHTLR